MRPHRGHLNRTRISSSAMACAKRTGAPLDAITVRRARVLSMDNQGHMTGASWPTLTEAAARSGYTREALRLRVRRGKLRAVKGNDGVTRLDPTGLDPGFALLAADGPSGPEPVGWVRGRRHLEVGRSMVGLPFEDARYIAIKAIIESPIGSQAAENAAIAGHPLCADLTANDGGGGRLRQQRQHANRRHPDQAIDA